MFDFVPKFVWILYRENEVVAFSYHTFVLTELLTSEYTKYGLNTDPQGLSNTYGKRSTDGKTIYWYNTNNTYGAGYQGNQNGYVYRYIAIG